MIQSVRGMRDIHGEEVAAWQRIERIFQEQSHAFGYSEFRYADGGVHRTLQAWRRARAQ